MNNEQRTALEIAKEQYERDVEGWFPQYWPSASRIQFAEKVAIEYAAQQTAALREELEKAETRYRSAVNGRAAFRRSYKSSLDELEAVKKDRDAVILFENAKHEVLKQTQDNLEKVTRQRDEAVKSLENILSIMDSLTDFMYNVDRTALMNAKDSIARLSSGEI